MTENTATHWQWWKGLTPYHWFVFSMASLAWMFDCLDQQIFIIKRKDALTDLFPVGTDASVVDWYAGIATSIFMVGWATGGLIFGSVGDRFGRARTLTLTVLLYSVCTGISAFSQGWIDFAIYRFITGLGVGGVFGLAVALIADSLPPQSRTGALGTLQALSAVGNITAGLAGMLVTKLQYGGQLTNSQGWQTMFLIGALPAFLCVFLQLQMKEPENWVKARKAGRETGVKFGSYATLFGDRRWRFHAIMGMFLCVSGVIGIWGIGFFSPDFVRDVISNNLKIDGVPDDKVKAIAGWWVSINSICTNAGAFAGMIGFTYAAQYLGRKTSFVIAYMAAMVATIAYFQRFNGVSDIWMSSVMGFFQMSLFAGFAIYLPELFPLRLRSTGTSFCYNAGRFIAATGPFTLAELRIKLAPPGTSTLEKITAFRDACSYMSVIFLVGLIVVFFLPETKGKPLPE